MFTGIIQTIGTISQLSPTGGDLRMSVEANAEFMKGVQLGDSIANNGVCLTVIEFIEAENIVTGFSADMSNETLSLTTLGECAPGSRLNLEKALTAEAHLGGHIVSGHVDGLGEVISRESDARAERFTLRAPDVLAKYIAKKGSITIDGTSLTINEVNGAEFEIAIVPHTLDKTIIGSYQVGTKVNLEVDLIARYLERLLLGDKAAEKTQ